MGTEWNAGGWKEYKIGFKRELLSRIHSKEEGEVFRHGVLKRFSEQLRISVDGVIWLYENSDTDIEFEVRSTTSGKRLELTKRTLTISRKLREKFMYDRSSGYIEGVKKEILERLKSGKRLLVAEFDPRRELSPAFVELEGDGEIEKKDNGDYCPPGLEEYILASESTRLFARLSKLKYGETDEEDRILKRLGELYEIEKK